MKRFFGTAFWIAIFCIIVCIPTKAHAQYQGDNNKYGVHLISPTDEEIQNACRFLANANPTGDEEGWGGKLILTLVKGQTDSDTVQRWHDISRNEGCILIHPIKNSFGDPYWKPIDQDTITFFVELFKDLRPSSKHLFVILGNEVNRGDEWGGTCDGGAYARIAKSAAQQLKEAVPNIQIGLAGLDGYAPDSSFYCSQDKFLRDMVAAEPQLVDDYIDFQVVHEYPNADMTGSLQNLWLDEKNLLKSLGVKKDLPIVVSEIAWKRHRGLSAPESAARLADGMADLNDRPEIWAITPFVYKFCGQPFEPFSLIDCAGDKPNVVFNAVVGLPKVKGDPEHVHKGRSQTSLIPEIIGNTDYEFELQIINQGTDVWRGISGDYSLKLFGPVVRSSFSSFHRVRPEGILRTNFRINAGDVQGCPDFRVALMKDGRVLLDLFSWKPCVVPHPDIKLSLATFPGNAYNGVGQMQIFDPNEKMIFAQQANVTDGVAEIKSVTGVRFEDLYRVVWLSPGNLPVQIVDVSFHKGVNELKTSLLLPIDRDQDGALSLSDVLQGFR